MSTPRKTIILLDHYDGRLGNQLWPFMALYAYCLERGYELRNYCFSNYADDFDIPVGNWLINALFYSPLRKITIKKWSPIRHWLYPKYVAYIKNRYPDARVIDTKEVESWSPFYLPPTLVTNAEQKKQLDHIESPNTLRAYITGWMYRNPVGLEKYRNEVISYFTPKKHIQDYVEATLKYPRSRFKHVVGVHYRLGDYRYVEDRQFFFEADQVRKMLEEYVVFSGIPQDDICFIICSDETLNPDDFKGLNIFLPKGTPTEDIFTLSAADVIIGSDSTFGPFAAYYGNVPFIIFDRKGIDWEYYRGKKTFFVTTKPNRVFY